ncbi:MAG: tetratricopeptide repeat protein [Thermoanaerobaculia bacterium]
MRNRRRPATTATIFLLAVIAGTACDKIRARQRIRTGHEFFKAAQYQAALASYQEAQRLDPGEKKLNKFIGETYIAMYQPGSRHRTDLEFAGKAIDNLRTYLDAYPKDTKAREFLVSMYLATDRFDDAIGFYQDLLKSNSNDTKAMQSLAAMYFRKGDFDKGVEWEEKRAGYEPGNPEAYVMIGIRAWDRSYNYPDLEPATRAKIVQEGLEALDKALKMKADAYDALVYVNLLYREKAKMETDPAKQQEFITTAEKYRDQALELRKKTLGTTPAAEPGK